MYDEKIAFYNWDWIHAVWVKLPVPVNIRVSVNYIMFFTLTTMAVRQSVRVEGSVKTGVRQ